MSADPAIRSADAGKRYVKYDDEPMLLTRALALHRRSRRSTLWALRHLDLAVQPGESLGVMGRNGSGKSTLLQMLAGVTAPTEGMVAVRGRIAPLVSVGVGFHPELTGRENVYVNGMILGLSRAEVSRRFDAIVDFSGIERFIDTPVKFYSSGMYVRLGFSVAVQVTPDVLLVDEVLAVGDVSFQVKCFQRMREIREAGTTVVVVTHNMAAMRQLCPRALVLHDGENRFDGDVDDALGVYHRLLDEYGAADDGSVRGIRSEKGVAEIESVRLLGDDGRPVSHVTSGDRVTLEVVARFDRPVARPAFGLAVTSSTGVNVYSDNTGERPQPPVAAGESLACRMAMRLPLSSGSYTLRASVNRVDDEDYRITRLDETSPVSFFVSGRTGMGGLVDLHADIQVAPD